MFNPKGTSYGRRAMPPTKGLGHFSGTLEFAWVNGPQACRGFFRRGGLYKQSSRSCGVSKGPHDGKIRSGKDQELGQFSTTGYNPAHHAARYRDLRFPRQKKPASPIVHQ
jgi:hypothetical protein